MSVKTLIRDLSNLDVSKCVFDCWINPKKKSFCPLGSLAVQKGYKVDWSRFPSEKTEFSSGGLDIEEAMGHEMAKLIETKYQTGFGVIDEFTTTYDRVRKQKKGSLFAKQKAIRAMKSFAERYNIK